VNAWAACVHCIAIIFDLVFGSSTSLHQLLSFLYLWPEFFKSFVLCTSDYMELKPFATSLMTSPRGPISQLCWAIQVPTGNTMPLTMNSTKHHCDTAQTWSFEGRGFDSSGDLLGLEAVQP
jgi:hypothetical protein